MIQPKTQYRDGHAVTVSCIGPNLFTPYIGINAAMGNTDQNPDYLLVALVPTSTEGEAWKAIDRAFVVLGLTVCIPIV